MSPALGILVALVLLAVNAFFVGAEFALISSRRSSIEPLAQAGSRRARTTLVAMEQVSLMLAGAQLGITLASLGLGAVAEPAVAGLLEDVVHALGAPEAVVHPIAFVIALLIVVFLHVVLGETVPKNLAIAGPERAALVLVPMLMGLVRVLRPFISGLNHIANFVLRLLRIQPKDEVDSAFTRDEVAGLIAESHREGLLDASELGLLAGALHFETRTARDVLIPSSALVSVPTNVTPAEVEQLSVRTGYSRFPIADDAGDLIGYLHLKDVLETDPVLRHSPVRQKWVRPLPHVNATETLGGVLADMRRQGTHLARATESDGTLVGVIGLGDVLAELVREAGDARQPGSATTGASRSA